jgi:hypothetical protein
MKALSGSFQDFLEFPHSRITSTNWVGPINDPRAMLLDRDSRFRQALDDFGRQLEAYINGPRRAAPKPQAHSETSSDRLKRSYVVDGDPSTPQSAARAGSLYSSEDQTAILAAIADNPRYRHTDCESWFDQVEKIKKAANMPPREVAKLALEEGTWLALVRRLPGANIGDEEARELRQRMLNWINSEVV